MYDVVIIGAGTAGLSAAIYAKRAGKSVMVLEEAYYGGQIVNTPHVENYPGIKEISGFDFATGIYEQAVELGTEIVFAKAEEIRNADTGKEILAGGVTYPCKSIILATGSKNRPLGLEHERELTGKGISYCATCDGAFFKGKTVAVFGGGNTAVADALYLSDTCETVYLIHRRNEFRAEKELQQRLSGRKNIVSLMEKRVTALFGNDSLTGIEIEDVVTGEKTELKTDGLFVAIGRMPDNYRFENVVELDKNGYIMAGEDCKTKTGGIFAAGDCRTKQVRQLTTAAADGAVAALAACEYVG